LEISGETDRALRADLAQNVCGRRTSFVEDAVRWRVLDRTVAGVKSKNAKLSPKEVQAAIDDALEAVRAERFKSTRSRR